MSNKFQNSNSKFVRDFFLVTALIILALTISPFFAGFASAQGYIPIPSEKLCGNFPCPEGGTGVAQAKSLAGRLVDNARYLIGAIAILIIIISGVKLVMSSGNEEVFTKEKNNLLYAIIGLFIVGLAGEIATIFEVDRGGFLKDPNVAIQKSRIFNRTVEIIITFIKYIIGSVAVIFIVRNGLRLVLLGGNEDEVGKDKKNILWGLLGLVVILLANPIINKVFFKIDTSKYPGIEAVRPGIDPARLTAEIAGATNLVASIAGPFALLSLVAGGLMYTLAGGDDEKTGKAKKIIIWSLIGLVVIYGAFAIVSTFVARRFEGI